MNETITCPSCRQQRKSDQLYSHYLIPEPVRDIIHDKHPHWPPDQPVCEICVEEGKSRYMEEMIAADTGRVTDADLAVIESIRDEKILSANENERLARTLTRSESVAASVAALVGSWHFPGAILLFLLFWLIFNYAYRPFEPFPTIIFATISAVLGTLAALYGPFILMTQRAQQKRDRTRAENDYRINLKAELEIQYLSEQIELLLKNQEALLKEVQRREGER